MTQQSFSVIGFDSAWTGKPEAPGAVCVIRSNEAGEVSFREPELASFAQALTGIDSERSISRMCLVSIDQPTIVPNMTSLRPVDRVAGSLISWIGGGVQPANRSKKGMFDDDAPIWRFKENLAAIENPEQARHATDGTYVMEVFPALALAGINADYCVRLGGPRYNPARRKTFEISHWKSVVNLVTDFGARLDVHDLKKWCDEQLQLERPRKADQDKLDAVICALIGLHWKIAPRHQSVMIGDLSTGYMIAPALNGVHERLKTKGTETGVAIDGVLPAQ